MTALRFVPTPDGRVRKLGDGERRLTADARIVQRQTRHQAELIRLAAEYAEATTDASRDHVAAEIRRTKYAAGVRVQLGAQAPSVPMPDVTRTRVMAEGYVFTGKYDKNGDPVYRLPPAHANHFEQLAGRTLVRRWGRNPQTRLWSGTRFPDRLAPVHYETYDRTLGMSVRDAMKPDFI